MKTLSYGVLEKCKGLSILLFCMFFKLSETESLRHAVITKWFCLHYE